MDEEVHFQMKRQKNVVTFGNGGSQAKELANCEVPKRSTGTDEAAQQT